MLKTVYGEVRRWLTGTQFQTSFRVRSFIYAALAILLYLILIGTVLPQKFSFQPGDISRVNIQAPFNATDTEKTQEARKLAANEVQRKYTLDTKIEDDALSQVDKLYESALLDSSKDQSSRLTQLAQVAPPKVSKEVLQSLSTMTPVQIRTVQNVTDQIVQAILGNQFTSEMARNAGPLVDSRLVTMDLDRTSRVVIRSVVLSVLQPNMVYSPSLTEQAQELAEKNVPDIMINKGDTIVRQGEIVDSHIIQKLRDLKLLSEQPNYPLYIGFAGLIGICMTLLGVYIQFNRREVAKDNRLLLLLASLFIGNAILLKVVNIGLGFGISPHIFYLAPISMAAIVIAVALDTQLALLSSVFFSLFASVSFDYQFQYAFVTLCGCFVGVLAVARVKQRQTFMRAGFLVAIANMVAITVLHFLLSADGVSFYIYDLVSGLVGGLFAAVLTIGILPFIESLFGLLTPIKLLELANPNHPLLRSLLLEAPGTYHHSLIVGNLAEAAAEEVGADPLLCRVGAMFHDVGKSRRPQFFIENQLGGENPHDKIAPSLSRLVITAHVKDGVEMLEEYRLPMAVRAIAAEHHGTTVLWYFYNKALKQDKSQVMSMDDYRYPGPKPRSREAAIVMLCDAIEAAVRSMSNPDPNRVEALIRKIVKDRLNDGQLDECDLTLLDLEKATQAFMRTLSGIYHARIEYPDASKMTKGDK